MQHFVKRCSISPYFGNQEIIKMNRQNSNHVDEFLTIIFGLNNIDIISDTLQIYFDFFNRSEAF